MRTLIVAALLAGCAGPSGPELLRNRDFEQLDPVGFAAEWKKFDGNPAGQIVLVKTPRVSGEFALQWQIDANGEGYEYWVSQRVDAAVLVPGHRYELSGYYFVDQPGLVALNYIVRGQPNDTPDLSTVSDAPIYPNVVGQFAPFNFEFEIPGDAAPDHYEVSLHSIKFTHSSVHITIDSVSLREM